MGSLDWEVWALDFGCMRFRTKKVNGNEEYEEEKAIEKIRYAIDNGMNYFDTAFQYHNEIREKVKLVTKLIT